MSDQTTIVIKVKGHLISSVGACVILLCFFLPWLLASCGGTQIEFSGWDLAAGKTIYGDRLEGNFFFFVIPLAALLTLFVAHKAKERGYLTDQYDKKGLIFYWDY